MAAAKKLVGEAWCPRCKCHVGKIYEKEVREGFFENSTVPKVIPKYCNMCEGVIERK
jgi:hypothetical protein